MQTKHRHTAKDEKLYLFSMGKRLQVTAIFTDDAEANDHMMRTNDTVIATFGPFIFLASMYDKGEPVVEVASLTDAIKHLAKNGGRL